MYANLHIGRIVQISRGLMRNTWFPKGFAEYITGDKLKEVIANKAIAPHDTSFGQPNSKILASTEENTQDTIKSAKLPAWIDKIPEWKPRQFKTPEPKSPVDLENLSVRSYNF